MCATASSPVSPAGRRSAIRTVPPCEDAQRKLQFDLFYVKNHSLVLDVLILAETVRVVLFGEGAQ